MSKIMQFRFNMPSTSATPVYIEMPIRFDVTAFNFNGGEPSIWGYGYPKSLKRQRKFYVVGVNECIPSSGLLAEPEFVAACRRPTDNEMFHLFTDWSG